MISNLLEAIKRLAGNYRSIRTAKIAELSAEADPEKETSIAAAARSITDSVGRNGANKTTDVKLVQSLLNRHGAKLSADGAIGPKTIAAIESFQRNKVGLASPDGRIAPNGRSWNALNSSRPGATSSEQEEEQPSTEQPQTQAPAKSISASVGQGGKNEKEDVRTVQILLNAQGASIGTDGLIGPKTIRAIIDFQRSKVGLSSPDGRIDPGGRSWTTLTGSAAATTEPNTGNSSNDNTDTGTGQDQTSEPTVATGSNVSSQRADELADQTSDKTSPLRGGTVGGGNAANQPNDVKIVQELLGLNATGKADAKLEQAIRDFQSKLGLGVDGIIGAMGIRYLTAYQKALNDIPDRPGGMKIQNPLPSSRFTSPFGKRFGRMHKGVDMAKGGNAAVYAVADGIASVKKQFGNGGGAGNYVVIDHGNGYESLYMHLKSASATGPVKAGDKIGVEGGTGYASGKLYPIHLHFEVRINDSSVDPMPFLTGAKLFPPA